MLWINEEVETTRTAVVDDPAVVPVLGVLDDESSEDKEADSERFSWPWADLTELVPVVVLDARDPDEEDEEEEDEEDADFFDDEEEEDEDLDDDLEDDDFEEEEFEEDEEEDEEDEEDDL
jgi:segregation and condensation protein B